MGEADEKERRARAARLREQIERMKAGDSGRQQPRAGEPSAGESMREFTERRMRERELVEPDEKTERDQ
ncbi:hypothetical protein [Streptomyces sp. NPDC053069]|uniref:hypothetical protein n=1 Tax=Streptomyces sp. NPDC053069 TaxID=3365695 RepID=UPI0037CDB00E